MVDEFRQHDGVVMVVVKNNLRRASPSTTETMTEDELEGRGCRHTAWGFLDVFRVLALPLYLYVEPWGRDLEKKPPQGRFGPQGKSPTRTPGPDARDLGVWPQTPGSLASGP